MLVYVLNASCMSVETNKKDEIKIRAVVCKKLFDKLCVLTNSVQTKQSSDETT